MGARGLALLLAVLLALVSGYATASDTQLDRLQALRSESFRAVSSVLLGYDALSGQLAREQREEYLASLAAMSAHMADPALAPLAGVFSAFADALRGLATEDGKAAPVAINRFLSAQAQLAAAADEAYRRLAPGSPALKIRLQALSLATGQVLVLHQMRPYGGLVVHPGLPLNEEVLAALDRGIVDDLQQLQREGVPPSGDVDALLRSYRFVRPKLFEADRAVAGYGVHHYLSRNMQRLDELAAGF